MRKLKLQVQITVDGFIAGPNGEMDWVNFPWDDELKAYVGGIHEAVDGILLGRKLAEGFIPHWAARPEWEDDASIDQMNNTAKVVFTRTLETSEWPNTVLATGDLTEEVNAIKAKPGGDLIVYGGGTFVSHLIAAGLIDEFHLFVNPVALGKGMPIFASLESKANLELKEARGFACGIVLLRYEPKGS
jgi:dihydrofolate reductase